MIRWLILAAALLIGAPVAAQTVTTLSPPQLPVNCSTNRGAAWSGTAWVCSAGMGSSIQTAVVAANSATTIPAGCAIQDIFITNTTANAITGGLKFGTTAGATDIVVALAVGASVLTFVTDATLLKRTFAGAQTVFIDAVVSWNSASVNVTTVYVCP